MGNSKSKAKKEAKKAKAAAAAAASSSTGSDKATPAAAPAPAPEPKPAAAPAAAPAAQQKVAESKSEKKVPVVGIVYYSMYGHIRSMALVIRDGLKKEGVEVRLMQVPETLSEDVLAKMGAPPKSDDEIATPDAIAACDGLIFGIPTRFGMACAQMKAFMDSTGGLWQKQSLAGKPASIFVSTGTQGGGQETTALTFLTQFTHHGLIFLPLGFSDPGQFSLEEIHGGSPYGAGTFAGPDGSRSMTDLEKKIAETQAKRFADVVKKLTV
eukprot:CAMPEP_0171497888 /NCGR_PEP_ID=MMETSP0958-20121227/7528_1 /TAXON_ID=87120 /ORGANISM="Aurantiochytrium limacinum, Strain ATCCMYA-1381" /LENGTH=267 /DNA_ID=CAMNT_0012032193 /DNA_START=77 /DNA_END=880 /DNA_ORIENTATION=+